MPELDTIIHQPVRLRIMAALCQLPPGIRTDFSFLKATLGVTDGNLGSHLATLEGAGYLAVEKTFVQRRPKTYLCATCDGRHAFENYAQTLRIILSQSHQHPQQNE